MSFRKPEIKAHITPQTDFRTEVDKRKFEAQLMMKKEKRDQWRGVNKTMAELRKIDKEVKEKHLSQDENMKNGEFKDLK